jgi:iron complex transport system ATP-binding protein
MSSPALIAHGLSFGPPPGRMALFEGLDLALPQGNLVALLGRNGAGKTTLLRVLAGFDRPISGTVSLMDRPLSQWPIGEWARQVAVMTTEKASLPWWTVREVVALGRQPHTGLAGKLRPVDEEAVDRALERTGLRDFARRRFDRLSDGERQTVLFARALAQETPFLLLDEPTAHLDFVGRKNSFARLAELAREAHKGILLATHEVELALAHADHLLLLDRATGWHSGTPETLVRSGAVERIFGPLERPAAGGYGRK